LELKSTLFLWIALVIKIAKAMINSGRICKRGGCYDEGEFVTVGKNYSEVREKFFVDDKK